MLSYKEEEITCCRDKYIYKTACINKYMHAVLQFAYKYVCKRTWMQKCMHATTHITIHTLFNIWHKTTYMVACIQIILHTCIHFIQKNLVD